MKKLIYKKVSDSIISINLHNGHTIIAHKIYNQIDKIFVISLYIKNNTIHLLDLMEKYDQILFKDNSVDINSAILKFVSMNLLNGNFDNYIKRYNYMLKCFDKGNEFFETKRLQNNCIIN